MTTTVRSCHHCVRSLLTEAIFSLLDITQILLLGQTGNCSQQFYSAPRVRIRYFQTRKFAHFIHRIGHRYGDRAVLRHIEKYLQDHLTVDNVCHVILLVDFYALADLRSICEHFIAHRFEKVAKTSAFKKLPQETKTALKVRNISLLGHISYIVWV